MSYPLKLKEAISFFLDLIHLHQKSIQMTLSEIKIEVPEVSFHWGTTGEWRETRNCCGWIVLHAAIHYLLNYRSTANGTHSFGKNKYADGSE